jgi:ankyrin repeat protein
VKDKVATSNKCQRKITKFEATHFRKLVTPNSLPAASLTSLHEAALRNDLQVLSALLDSGAKVDSRSTSLDGERRRVTALHEAAYAGNCESARLLLKRRAKINGRSSDGSTPLLVAANMGRTELAKLLVLSKADVNLTDLDGGSPLAAAVAGLNWDLTEFLLKWHANPNQKIIPLGLTVLMLAASQRDKRGVQLLLEHKADFKAVDDCGQNAVHHAVSGAAEMVEIKGDQFVPQGPISESLEIVRLLVAAGADVTLKNKQGLSPINVADRLADRQIYNFLRACH